MSAADRLHARVVCCLKRAVVAAEDYRYDDATRHVDEARIAATDLDALDRHPVAAFAALTDDLAAEQHREDRGHDEDRIQWENQ